MRPGILTHAASPFRRPTRFCRAFARKGEVSGYGGVESIQGLRAHRSSPAAGDRPPHNNGTAPVLQPGGGRDWSDRRRFWLGLRLARDKGLALRVENLRVAPLFLDGAVATGVHLSVITANRENNC